MKTGHYESTFNFCSANLDQVTTINAKARSVSHLIPAIILFLVSCNTYALSPDQITFSQSFESLTDIQSAGGICTLNNIECPPSVFVPGESGKALEIKKTGYPLVWFPVANTGTTYINPLKGTVTFNYSPLGDPDGDWGSTTPAIKTFFQLYDPSAPISGDRTLKIGTFYGVTSAKNYLYFRYDGTSGCLATYPPPTGMLYCQRETSTSPNEPGVIMQWQPNTTHVITASWDFTATRPYLELFIDGSFATASYFDTRIGLEGFNPTGFYVGSFAGSYPAQGKIDNLKIYSGVAIDPKNAVSDYINTTRNDGSWQTHETINDSIDAPSPIDLAAEPFIFYPSFQFEPIYEGNVPTGNRDITELVVHVAKAQLDTFFFNIYAGDKDLGITTASVSDVTNPSASSLIGVKIRSVKNWWQSGRDVGKTLLPVYVPELLVYDDTHEISCTGINIPGRPCNNAQFPSDSPMPFTRTVVRAHTSRQFAITLNVPADAMAGEYHGLITLISDNTSQKSLPLKVVVHDFILPPIDKIVALYNHSVFDISSTDSFVTQQIYEKQLQNMYDHGVNGTLFYGVSNLYPSLAATTGLTGFAGYIGTPTQEKVNWLSQQNYIPYVYGVDEPQNIRSNIGRNLIPEHLALSKVIHALQGKTVVAINKTWADNLNNPDFFPYADELGKIYTYNEAKLDLPNISADGQDDSYFTSLLNGGQKSTYPELYYWQMDREDPRINRFFTGYHLWLSNMDGIFPYVYQKIINNPFNDFDQAAGLERDLNLVYPSLEGGIDTVEWEGFRAGINDYRLLQLWSSLHTKLQVIDANKAAVRNDILNTLLSKYRNTKAYKTATISEFSSDRDTLFAEIDNMLPEVYPDLSLDVMYPTVTRVNRSFNYTMVTKNPGPTIAINTKLVVNLPAGLKYVSITSNKAACSGKTDITCITRSLSVGENVTTVLTVRPAQASTYTHTITVSTDEYDPVIKNNTVYTSINVKNSTR